MGAANRSRDAPFGIVHEIAAPNHGSSDIHIRQLHGAIQEAAMRAELKRSLIRRMPARVLPYLKSVQRSATLMGGGLLRQMPGSSLNFGPPRSIARSLLEYAGGRAQHEGTSFVELRPSELLARRLPPSGEDPPHPAFRSELRRRSPPAGIAVIAGGRVLTQNGAVIAPGDCLIADVSSGFLGDDPRTNAVFLSLKLPPLTTVSGAVAVLAISASDNYFHWLFDALPRLHLIEASGHEWDGIVAPRRTRFQRQTLAHLGIADHRILDARNTQIVADKLIVPTMPGVSGNPPRWACDFLRQRFLARIGDAPRSARKLYISRRKSGTRKVLNEEELETALGSEGFETLFLEDLDFLEQVRLFSEARVIVSAHGSGLSNLVFSPPGTGVVELFSPGYVNVCYWALANQLGLDYRYVLGEGAARPVAERGVVHENILINVASVRQTVHSLI